MRTQVKGVYIPLGEGTQDREQYSLLQFHKYNFLFLLKPGADESVTLTTTTIQPSSLILFLSQIFQTGVFPITFEKQHDEVIEIQKFRIEIPIPVQPLTGPL